MFHFSQITLKITIAPNFVILYTVEIKGCSERTAEMRRKRGGEEKFRLEALVKERAVFLVLNFRLLIRKHK
jgi:hypothetical protein